MESGKFKRVFKYDGKTLSDPNESMSVKDVLKHYSFKYPELTTGSVSPPKFEDDKAVYNLTASYKSKG